MKFKYSTHIVCTRDITTLEIGTWYRIAEIKHPTHLSHFNLQYVIRHTKYQTSFVGTDIQATPWLYSRAQPEMYLNGYGNDMKTMLEHGWPRYVEVLEVMR